MVSILDRDLRLCWMEGLSNFVRGRSEGLLDRARWISGGQRSCQEQLRTPGDHPLLNLRFLAGRSAVLLPSGTSSDPLGALDPSAVLLAHIQIHVLSVCPGPGTALGCH